MEALFHSVAEEKTALEHKYQVDRIYKCNLIEVRETDSNTWGYYVPSNSLLDKLRKGSNQDEFLAIIGTTETLIYDKGDIPALLPYKDYDIKKYIKNNKEITEADLDKDLLIKLKKKVILDSKGWATKVEYYENVDVTIDSVTGLQDKTYTNLYVEKVKSYTLDTNNNLVSRDLSIGYMNNRGTVDVLVEKTKNYTEFDERVEAQMKRRVNVIDAILVPFVLNKFKELGITANFTESDTNLKLFANELGNEIAAFKNYSDYDSLVTGVQNLTFTWLDTDDGGVTFKQRIIDKINASKL